MNTIVIDVTRAITPPSLFGIDCRIVYVNKKYDSGWTCTGFTRGFAGVKLSGSFKMYGSFRVSTVILSDFYFRGVPHVSWLCCQQSTRVILWLLSVPLSKYWGTLKWNILDAYTSKYTLTSHLQLAQSSVAETMTQDL